MKTKKWMRGCLAVMLATACQSGQYADCNSQCVSGIWPRLAYYNNEGECGTGAVVPWAGKLWVVTYGPHLPFGSSDKLYAVTPDMKQTVYEHSIGGTPANRMIHPESGQLFIGPYAIDSAGTVRTIPYKTMPGRHTGNARHLLHPSRKIYYGTMEEGIYEVDVHTLDVHECYRDGNLQPKSKDDPSYAPAGSMLPGVHGKGLYSGQGVLVFSNNGEGSQEALSQFDIEAGVLAEWDGKDWKVVRRNQFTEVTGPGGICGNPHPDTDPIWATGWDYKSVILGVRDRQKGWAFYRLPKASHSYDGAHGWNTEWPRIRNVGAGQDDYLMTMHGMFWRFPGAFTAANSAGIRPRSAYLKVVGDFCRWGDKLVFGCDDTAQKEFLNQRKAKGGIAGPGQSNSNLWFVEPGKVDCLGPTAAEGAVWGKEKVEAGVPSEPFLFAGWENRCAWIWNGGTEAVQFSMEVDADGTGRWQPLKQVTVGAGESMFVPFERTERGEWIRAVTDKATLATLSFNYADDDRRPRKSASCFKGLAQGGDYVGGLLYSLGDNRRSLGLLATRTDADGQRETGYYEMDDSLRLVRKEDPGTSDFIRTRMAIPSRVVEVDKASVVVTDDKGRRWRLPLGKDGLVRPTLEGQLRVCREVATERDLFSCMGTFYELPAENADGFAKMRPIATHPFHIQDYASYRGMLLLTGITPSKGRAGDGHVIVSADGQAAVWAGAIDDLWQMGKPCGEGGPWKDTAVEPGQPSDPYLIACYDKKTLRLSHSGTRKVRFTVEADPTGCADWMAYATFEVEPGQEVSHTFPRSFQARWVRVKADDRTTATAWFTYD